MRAGWLLLGLTWATACESELSFGSLRLAPDAGGTLAPDAGDDDGGTLPPPDAAPELFGCTQRGPLHLVSDSVESACPIPRGFHYALCSCDDLRNTTGGIVVDGFDSRRGPYGAGALSGSVAANGPLNASAGASIGGSLVVGGSVPLGGPLSVGGNFWVGGHLVLGDAPALPVGVTVGGDAWLAGDVRVSSFAAAGTVTLAEAAQYELDGGTYTRGPVAIPAPCACDDALDRNAIIEAARRDNDNGAIGFAPAQELRAESAPLELNLPCGRYYVDNIYGAHAITLRIVGRVALYIGDRILLDPGVPLTIALEGDGELDVFARNGITANGPVTIGSPNAPTRVRLYLGNESNDLYFGGPTMIAGSVYAPTADLVAKDVFELFGAAALGRAGGDLRMALHYDRALLADSCQAASCEPAQPCAAPLRCDVDRCLP